MAELNTLAPKKWVTSYGGVAPTIDTSDGVRVGDEAHDTSTSPYTIWKCFDNTEGAPVWRQSVNTSGNQSIDGVKTFVQPVQTSQIKTDATTPTDLTITTGSQKTLLLGTVVYDDIIIQGINLRVGASAPTFGAFQDSIYAIKFMNATTDIVYGSFEIPHTYKEGTDLEVHVHWSPSSTNTGACVWNFAYTKAAMGGGAFGAEAVLTLTQAGSGTINAHQYATANAQISGTGIGIGTIIVFALSRPAGDAFTGDAWLHSIGIHYQIDTMGSRQMGIK